jgi:hypothetical protein
MGEFYTPTANFFFSFVNKYNAALLDAIDEGNINYIDGACELSGGRGVGGGEGVWQGRAR